jgi:hypothetical protein
MVESARAPTRKENCRRRACAPARRNSICPVARFERLLAGAQPRAWCSAERLASQQYLQRDGFYGHLTPASGDPDSEVMPAKSVESRFRRESGSGPEVVIALVDIRARDRVLTIATHRRITTYVPRTAESTHTRLRPLVTRTPFCLSILFCSRLRVGTDLCLTRRPLHTCLHSLRRRAHPLRTR